MTKIDIFSGFLGAGKTTLIKKLIRDGFPGEKLVLIENEFGEIGIDSGFLKDAGINITEMNSGCICCSLAGDFGVALKKVLTDYSPDRILIEPSGVGKLSDVIKAVQDLDEHTLALNSYTAVVDVNRCKMYMKNFGEFFCDQICHAKCIVLSHTESAKEKTINECISLLKEQNPNAVIVSTPWDDLSSAQLLSAIEGTFTLSIALNDLERDSACPECGHHHDHADECCHHEHSCDCGCDHDHHDHHHEHCHKHEHHHEHGHFCHEHGHEHDHECCHHEHHHDHGHHHADDVFQSFGAETAQKYTTDDLTAILADLENEEKYGIILRAKGIVPSVDGNWLHFDYIPGNPDVRTGSAEVIGRICVIGSKICEDELKALFQLQN